jgi:hypothetical protein
MVRAISQQGFSCVLGVDSGQAGAAQLNSPQGIAVDSGGNIYISDGSNYRVRKVAGGVITTVAGNGTPGFSGDNGPATSAGLSQIFGLAFDSSGKLYIADTGDQRIRKVSNGTITTVAGIGFGNGGGLGDNGPTIRARRFRGHHLQRMAGNHPNSECR